MPGIPFIHKDVPGTVLTTGTGGSRYILSSSSYPGGGTKKQVPGSGPGMRVGGPAAQGGTGRHREVHIAEAGPWVREVPGSERKAQN